ncbi:GntR family transcriptional regulator [Ureibacillus composti]
MVSSTQGRISTKDYVYLQLKKEIVGGELLPEAQINELDLSKRFDISRTPLREALQRLEIEELVVRLPNGRLKISPVSVEDARSIFSVRSALEGLVTKSATQNANERDLEELRLLTDLLVKAANLGNNEDVIYYGDQIHHRLYDISQHKVAVKILNNMNDHIMRYRRIRPNTSHNRSKEAAKEHLELYETIAAGDAEKAEKLMQKHINNSLDAAIQSIEAHLQKQNCK